MRYRPTKVTIRLVFLLYSGMTTAPSAKMYAYLIAVSREVGVAPYKL